MVKEKNSLRNAKADKIRMEIFKNKTSLFSVFSKKELKIIFKYMRPYLKGIILLILLTLALSFLEGFKALSIVAFIKSFFIKSVDVLGNIKIFGREVSSLINFSDKNALTFSILGVFVVLSILSTVVKLITSIFTRRFRLNLMRDLRRDLYNKLVRFDVDFFNEARSGELLFMMDAEVSRFSSFILYFKNFISNISTLIIFMVILFCMSPFVSSFIMIFAGVFLFFHQRVEKKLKLASWEANYRRNTLQQIFHQIIYGMKLIKLGGLENRERDEYIEQHLEFEKEDMEIVKWRSISEAVRETFFIFILVLFSFVFFYFLNKGLFAKDNSFVLSYMFILVRIIPYFTGFQRSILNIAESYGPLAKIVDILDRPIEEKKESVDTEPLAARLATRPISDIKVEDLSFCYKGKEDILKSVSMKFDRGKMYAIVGFSGAGKSSLLDLMVNIRMPKGGKILFNNLEAKQIDPETLKDRIGYVNQEPLVFHDTIRENISFFKENSTIEEIDMALERAVLKEFVYSLPERLNTGLGERGLTVSGGERQRIGLARVLLGDPEILLLDEATNSLDYKTEKIIYDNLRKIKNDKIIVVVAHRLSSLVDFDEIIVLNNGMAEERGTHQELMNNRGIYYSLYKLQETGSYDV